MKLRTQFGWAILFCLTSLLAVSQSPRAHHDSLPDAPSAQPASSHFWQPRTSLKQVFKSPTFWASEGIAFATAYADARRNNCIANAPCGSAIYKDALIPFAVLIPMHVVTARFISPLIGWASCGYIAERHLRGIQTGVYP